MGETASKSTGSFNIEDQTFQNSSKLTSDGGGLNLKRRREDGPSSLSAELVRAGQNNAEGSLTIVKAAPPPPSPSQVLHSSSDIPSPSTVRRKHRMPGERICKVCGDKAVAHNFDVISCESCKTFFRRNAHKTLKPCQFQGNCDITVNSRRHCPYCRLQKCFNIGMRADLILDEAERKARMEKIQTNKKKRMEAAQKQEATKTNDSSNKSPCLIGIPDSNTVDLLPEDPDADLAVEAFLAELSGTGSSSDTQVINQHEAGICSSSDSMKQGLECLSDQEREGRQDCSSQQDETSQARSNNRHSERTESSVHHQKTNTNTNFTSLVKSDLPHSPNTGSLEAVPSSTSSSPDSHNANVWNSPPSSDDLLTKHVGQNDGGGDRKSKGLMFDGVPDCLFPSDPKMYWTLTPEEQSVIASLNTIFQEEFTKVSQPSIPDELIVQLEKLSLEETITQMDKFGLELVGFLKRVSDFHTLDVNDQQALLKANATLCLMVIASSTYSRERGAYLKGDKAVPPGLYGQVLGIEKSAHYAEFSYSLKTILGDDYSAFPLVACFVIFDPLASDVSDRQTVSFFRDRYTLLLKHYLDSRYSYMFAGQYLDAVYTTLRQGKLTASKFSAALSNWKDMMDPLLVELMNFS